MQRPPVMAFFYPLKCSCLENPRDGGAWWAAVYGVAQSWTRLKRLSSSSYCCSVAQSCPTLCNPMDCSMPGFVVPHHLPEFAQVHVHCISDAIQPPHPLSPSSPLPSVFPFVRVLSNELDLHIRWPKYWSFSFSISPPNAYSGFISFKIDWFALLAVLGTLKSLLQHHSSKESILQPSLCSNSHIQS